MKKLKAIICSLLSVAFIFFGFSFAKVAVAAEGDIPQAISVTFNGDVYTRRGFAWLTGKNVVDCRVEVIEAAEGMDKESIDWSSTSVMLFNGSYSQAKGNTVKASYNSYKATVTGLSPNKTYYYRIGSPSKNAYSDVGTIKTGDPDSQSLTFIDVTDPQEGSENGYKAVAQVFRKAFEMYPHAEFLMCNGDNVNTSHSSTINISEWIYLFDTSKDITMNYPYVATAGNHESADYAIYDRFNNDFAGTAAHGVYYSFDYGDVHFAILNTNDGSIEGAQAAWLRNDLANTGKKWKIVMLHWAAMTTGQYVDDSLTTKLRSLLLPIMAEYKVDLVLQGHNHSYLRTNPYSWNKDNVKPVTETEEIVEIIDGRAVKYAVEPSGTTYIIPNMCGNKQYPIRNPQNCSVATNPVTGGTAQSGFNANDESGNPSGDHSGQNPIFTAISIDFAQNRLLYEAYVVNRTTNTATLYDYYGIVKDGHEPVERLIDALPDYESFTLDDTENLQTALNSYNALYSAAKERISQQHKDKLDELSRMIDIDANLKVLEVERLISSIGEQVDLSTACLEKIRNASVAYESLIFVHQQQVRNYDALEAAGKTVLDLRFAQGVIDYIEHIWEGGATPEDVRAAKLAYNRLTKAQKDYVTNYSKLQELEQLFSDSGAGGCGSRSDMSGIALTLFIAGLLMKFFSKRKI